MQNDMVGAYAKFDQPEAQRYLAFRFVSYLRRYFTAMTMKRLGFAGSYKDPRARLNPGAGDAQLGFYIEFLKTKYSGEKKNKQQFRFDWENGLSELKNQYTSVELQHKANMMR